MINQRDQLKYGFEIGEINIKEGFTYVQHYETASWYTEVYVEPGVYKLKMAEKTEHRRDESYFFEVVGTVVSENTQSSFGGVAYGATHRPENIGKPYSLHKSILPPFTSFVSDNKNHNCSVVITAPFAKMGKGGIEIDRNHPEYKNAIKMELVRDVIKHCMQADSVPELIRKKLVTSGWLNDNTILEMIDSEAFSRVVIYPAGMANERPSIDVQQIVVSMMRLEAMIEAHTGKTLQESSVDIKKMVDAANFAKRINFLNSLSIADEAFEALLPELVKAPDASAEFSMSDASAEFSM